MPTPTFADTHNLVAFLEKPTESVKFEQIIDFLKSKPIHYALTVNPTIYVFCVKQFWATAKVQRVNDQEQKQTLVDKKKVIITENSIRSDLHFDDVDGTACLLNEEIFEGLARREVAPDESEDDDHVSTPSSDPLPNVTTVADKVNVAPTTNVTEDEIIMAQALAALKSVKPTIPAAAIKVTTVVPTPRAKGIVFHEQKQSHIPIVSSSKDKGNAKMIEPEVPIKKKDQMRMDEEYARQLEAEEQEAARLIRAQQDEEDIIS
nr:hypothetical protein [Tanacetum cinerariifolium]